MLPKWNMTHHLHCYSEQDLQVRKLYLLTAAQRTALLCSTRALSPLVLTLRLTWTESEEAHNPLGCAGCLRHIFCPVTLRTPPLLGKRPVGAFLLHLDSFRTD